MTTADEPKAHFRTTALRPSGRDAKRAARAARAAFSVPYITRALPRFEVAGGGGAEPHREQRRDDPRGDRPHLPGGSRGPAALEDGRRRRRRRARALSARPVSRAGAAHGTARIHPARAQSGPQRAHRRRRDGVRAGLRLAVHTQPRRRPPLRPHRGLPQLRQARLHGELAAPFRRHDLRAGRPAGQQAAPRHGLQPHQVQRQGVHGLGHAPGPRRGQRRAGEYRVRR